MIQKLRILTRELVALILLFASGVLVDGLMIPADKGYVDGSWCTCIRGVSANIMEFPSRLG